MQINFVTESKENIGGWSKIYKEQKKTEFKLFSFCLLVSVLEEGKQEKVLGL
jgi:hypothetical protein